MKIKNTTLSTFEGFKQFILRGNVVDLAVGVMIGAAFNAVITALVKDILTPLIAAIFKSPDFSAMLFTINGSKFMYGEFINALISFLIVAFAIYFFVVIPVNALVPKKTAEPAPTKKCPECKSDIPADATRCPYCTQKIA